MSMNVKSDSIFVTDDPESFIRSNINFYYSPTKNLLYFCDPESQKFIGVSVNSDDLKEHNNDTTNVHGIANTANLTTKAYVDNQILGLASVYLTQENAQTTYTSQSSFTSYANSVSNTYLTQNVFNTTISDYLTQLDAENIYLTQEIFENTIENYLTEEDASLTYLTQVNASSTYATLTSPTFNGIVSLPSTTSIGDVSSTEIEYLNGVTSSIQTQFSSLQTQIDGKEKSIPLQNTAPTSPSESDLWVDNTDPTKPILKVYNGTSWVTAGSSITADDDQIILASRIFT